MRLAAGMALVATLIGSSASGGERLAGEPDFLSSLEQFRRDLGPFTGAAPVKAASPSPSRDAVVRVGTVSQCSGIYVSNQGDVLTAAHCLRELLSRARRSRLGPFELWEHDGAATAYPERIAGTAGGRPARLVVAGRGAKRAASRPVDLSSLAGDEDGLARLSAVLAGDWALLRTGPPATGGCAPASEAPLPAGSAVCAVGYPGGGARAEVCGTTTVEFQARWFEPYAGGAADRAATEQVYRRSLSAGAVTVQIARGLEHGISGGGLFDAKGTLVGVVTGGGLGETGSAVSLASVFAALRSSGLRPEEYFSCR